MKALTQRELKEKKGVPWSREHIRRKVKAGEFPKPFQLTPGGRNLWNEEEIDAWLERRAQAARDFKDEIAALGA